MTPILNFIILADKAEFKEGKKLSIDGLFTNIRSKDFPATHEEMFVVIEAFLDKGDYEEVLKFEHNGAENEIAHAHIKQNEKGNHLIVHNLKGVPFREEGDYFAKIYIDGTLLGTRKFALTRI